MGSLNSIIGDLANLIVIRLTGTLSRQIEAARHDCETKQSGMDASLQSTMDNSAAPSRTFAQRIQPDPQWRLKYAGDNLESLRSVHDKAVQSHQMAIRDGQPQERIAEYERTVNDAAAKLRDAATAHERLLLSVLEPGDRSKLKKAAGAIEAAVADRDEMSRQYSTAKKRLDDERSAPTGADQTKLAMAVISLQESLDKATVVAEKKREAHSKLKADLENRVTRESVAKDLQRNASGQRPTDRDSQKLRNPLQRGWRRNHCSNWSTSGGQWNHARRAHTTAVQRHQSARSTFRSAMQNYRAAKIAGNNSAMGAARRTATMAARNMRIAAATVSTARNALPASTVSSRREATSTRAAKFGASGANGTAVAHPVVGFIGALTAALLTVRSFVNRAVQSSEKPNESQFRVRSTFNSQFSAAMAHHDSQDLQTGYRAPKRFDGSSTGLRRSTMDMKGTSQPGLAAMEDIGNRIASATAETVTMLTRVLCPLAQVLGGAAPLNKLMELLPWVKRIAEQDKPGMPIGMSAMQAVWRANKATRHTKQFPKIPPLK